MKAQISYMLPRYVRYIHTYIHTCITLADLRLCLPFNFWHSYFSNIILCEFILGYLTSESKSESESVTTQGILYIICKDQIEVNGCNALYYMCCIYIHTYIIIIIVRNWSQNQIKFSCVCRVSRDNRAQFSSIKSHLETYLKEE